MRDTSAEELELTESVVGELGLKLRGELLTPDSEGYEEARKVYNAMIDRHPRLIARCRDTADVIAAVNFARDNNMLACVRGGGHNVAGLGICDGGLLIDLTLMRGVWIDPDKRTARVQGGCKQGDLDHAAHAFGLATPGGMVSTTGVGGLTLGGGFGYLSRKYGLMCDNLLSAEVVTADGRMVIANAQQNEDLFWAIRGGGGNFGIVTSFEFQLHPVSMVYGGPIFYPVDKAQEVMKFYREYITQIPEDMSTLFGFHILPPTPFIPVNLQGLPVSMLFPTYIGAPEEGERLLKPVKEVTEPVLDLTSNVPYPVIQQTFDMVLTPGLYHYWKAEFFNDISDGAVEVHAEYGKKDPNFRSGMHFYPLNGAVHNVGSTETAFHHRNTEFIMVIVGVSDKPEDMSEITQWVKDYWSALQPYSAGAAYVNFLGDEGKSRIRATYGDNYERLQQIKKKWDPDNFFCVNQNIEPAE